MIPAGADIDGFWTAFWAHFHDALDDRGELPCFVVGRVDGRVRLNPGTALEFAAEVYGTTPSALLARWGGPDLTEARALAVWALRNVGPKWSYSAIGRALGGRSHTTIRDLSLNADELIHRSARFAGACEDMRRRFEGETQLQ